MALDPQLAELLNLIKNSGLPPMQEAGPVAARAQLLQQSFEARTPEQVVPVASTEDIKVSGGEAEVDARVYRPEGTGPFPVIAFFHGGGFVIGDLNTHDNMARNICRGGRAIVVAVDYRLAPEHPFPAAVDDAVAASRWIASHVEQLGGNGQFAVAGESAGGNLAAVVAQTLHAEGTKVVGQFLIYPPTDIGGEYPSQKTCGSGYFLEPETMMWFGQNYLGSWTNLADPRLSPLRATSLAGLAPALIVTAEFDGLRDEGEAYGKALQEAGVDVQMERCLGMMHGFFDMGVVSPAAQAAIDRNCERFGQLLRR